MRELSHKSHVILCISYWKDDLSSWYIWVNSVFFKFWYYIRKDINSNRVSNLHLFPPLQSSQQIKLCSSLNSTRHTNGEHVYKSISYSASKAFKTVQIPPHQKPHKFVCLLKLFRSSIHSLPLNNWKVKNIYGRSWNTDGGPGHGRNMNARRQVLGCVGGVLS